MIAVRIIGMLLVMLQGVCSQSAVRMILGGKSGCGVLVSRSDGLVLASTECAISWLRGGKAQVMTSNGCSSAKIVAADPLYEVCVVQVDNPDILRNVQECSWASDMVLHGRAVFFENDCVKSEAATCSKRACVLHYGHPAQSVWLHDGGREYSNRPVLVNAQDEVMGVWVQEGWVPLSPIRHLVDDAKDRVKTNRTSLGECYALKGVVVHPWSGEILKALCGEGDVGRLELVVVMTLRGYDSGLRTGDVILSVEGERLLGRFDALVRRINKAKKEMVSCTVLRDKKVMNLTIPILHVVDSVKPTISVKNFVIGSASQRTGMEYGVPRDAAVLLSQNCMEFLWGFSGEDVSYTKILCMLKNLGAYTKNGCFVLEFAEHGTDSLVVFKSYNLGLGR